VNERALRPANVAAGGLTLAGILMIAIPQHVLGIVQVTIVAIAAAAGVYALAAHLPAGGWISPFKWGSPFAQATHVARTDHPAHELDLIARRMSGVRYELDGVLPPLPPKTLRLLQRLVRSALDLDPDVEPDLGDRGRVTSLTWAVLHAEVPTGPAWRRWRRARLPNSHEVASVVHRLVDDLDRLAELQGPGSPTHSSHRDLT
jgi:hypothetical protein